MRYNQKENRSCTYIIFIPELNTTWHRHLNQILEFTKVNDKAINNNKNNAIPSDNGKASFSYSDSANLREESDVDIRSENEKDVIFLKISIAIVFMCSFC